MGHRLLTANSLTSNPSVLLTLSGVTGFHGQAKRSSKWSNQPGKLILTAAQFAQFLALNETSE